MKQIVTYILIFSTVFSFAQEEDNAKELAKIKQNANNLVYDANDLASNDDFVSAEMEYRRALSTMYGRSQETFPRLPEVRICRW